MRLTVAAIPEEYLRQVAQREVAGERPAWCGLPTRWRFIVNERPWRPILVAVDQPRVKLVGVEGLLDRLPVLYRLEPAVCQVNSDAVPEVVDVGHDDQIVAGVVGVFAQRLPHGESRYARPHMHSAAIDRDASRP